MLHNLTTPPPGTPPPLLTLHALVDGPRVAFGWLLPAKMRHRPETTHLVAWTDEQHVVICRFDGERGLFRITARTNVFEWFEASTPEQAADHIAGLLGAGGDTSSPPEP